MSLDVHRWQVLGDELSIASAIVTWYIGTVLGVQLAIYLLTNRSIRVVLLTTAALTVCTPLIYLSSIVQVGDKACSLVIIWAARLIAGISSGATYFTVITLAATDHLSSLIWRTKESSTHLTVAWILLFVPITYVLNGIGLASNLPLNPVQGEYFCHLSSLIFAVFVLFLSIHLSVADRRSICCGDKLCLVHVQSNNNNSDDDSDTTVADAQAHHTPHAFGDRELNQTFFDDPNIRPLMYLIGAKLLTIFCSNIPFFYIAINYFTAIDAVHIKRRENVSQCHLIALLCARVLLGAVANSNNKSLFVYVYKVIKPMAGMLGANLLICLVLRHSRANNGPTALQRHLFDLDYVAGWFIVCAYIGCSLCADAFSHANAISQSKFPVIKRPLAIAFAACIEHLIHILFIVVYLSHVANIKLFMFSFVVVGIGAMWQTQGGRIKHTNPFYGKQFRCEFTMDIL